MKNQNDFSLRHSFLILHVFLPSSAQASTPTPVEAEVSFNICLVSVINENGLKNEGDLKNEDDLKNENNLKNEDDLKNKEDIKKEEWVLASYIA